MTWDAYPLRNRRGELVPWAADYLTGKREADRLAALGMTVDRTQVRLSELGRAVRETQEAEQTPEQWAEEDGRLAALVDQLKERNRVERQAIEQAPDTAPERLNGIVPEANEQGRERGVDAGHLDVAARPQVKDRDRFATVEDFLKESTDEHGEWS